MSDAVVPSYCPCEFCRIHGSFNACSVREMILRITQLELAIKDALKANSVAECAAALHIFRILMEAP